MRIGAAIAASLLLAPQGSLAHACSVSDFAVANVQWKNTPDVESIRVTGRILNNCDSPAYPTVQLIYIDKDGSIVDSTPELWLAGMTDIPPHSPRQFVWFQHFIGYVVKIDSKILSVRSSR